MTPSSTPPPPRPTGPCWGSSRAHRRGPGPPGLPPARARPPLSRLSGHRHPAGPPDPGRAPLPGAAGGQRPLRFEAWPEPGRLVLSRRRDGQTLELLAVKDPNVRVMKLLRGEIDLLQNDLSPELMAFLAQPRGPGDEGTRGQLLLSWVESGRPGDGCRRCARPWRMPSTARRSCATCSRATAAGDRLFPPGHWAASPDLGPALDPEPARALLAEAGLVRIPCA